MKRFAALYSALDRTTRSHAKVQALAAYLSAAPPEDAVWAVSLLMGRKPRQAVPAGRLRRWAAEEAGVPDWLFAAAYDVVGDLAETITLILEPGSEPGERPLHRWIEEVLLPLRALPEAEQRRVVTEAWRALGTGPRLVLNKLITGGFRVGVSQKLVTRALARLGGVPEAVIAHRLMGAWRPDPRFWEHLFAAGTEDAAIGRPYPFFLAYPLDTAPEELGEAAQWQVEWKWDGIRAQVIRRGGELFIWSRGEELVTEKFPEIAAAGRTLPEGSVLDGEILPWQSERPLPFAALQRRIGRKHLTPAILRAAPAVLMAYDLLEREGRDLRGHEFSRRRAALEEILEPMRNPVLRLSPRLAAAAWPEVAALREEARRRGVEGVMVKRLASVYGVGRRRGDWWKWKVDPFRVDAVLTYAQRGHGKRAGLYTDYTFSVWDDERLVPFAKAYSGLTDAEIREVDRFIRRNSLERFGPVRAVTPELVFEIAFEEIRPSPRHRSGVAVRFPRIARRRPDKRAAEADTLATLQALLPDPLLR
jgi:DNA ligase-1